MVQDLEVEISRDKKLDQSGACAVFAYINKDYNPAVSVVSVGDCLCAAGVRVNEEGTTTFIADRLSGLPHNTSNAFELMKVAAAKIELELDDRDPDDMAVYVQSPDGEEFPLSLSSPIEDLTPLSALLQLGSPLPPPLSSLYPRANSNAERIRGMVSTRSIGDIEFKKSLAAPAGTPASKKAKAATGKKRARKSEEAARAPASVISAEPACGTLASLDGVAYVVLCTDGVWDHVAHNEIVSSLAQYATPGATARAYYR